MNDTEIAYLSIFIIILFVVLVVGTYLYNKKKYEESIYFQSTKIPFWQIRHDLGHYGEFLIYNHLKVMELEGAKLIFLLICQQYMQLRIHYHRFFCTCI